MKFVTFFNLCFITYCYAVSLPQDFDRCKISEELDSKPNECLRKSIMKALRLLKDGNEELKVPSLDPLRVEKMSLEQGSSSSPVNIELTFKNLDLIGISSIDVTNVTGKLVSSDSWNMNIEGRLKRFYMIGDYEINGKILVLPIVGNGKCNVTFVNPKIFVNAIGERKIKNGNTYLKINKYVFNENLDRIYLKFDNLFNGNSALGASTNAFFNENWRILYNELSPNIDKAIAKVVGLYAKKILEKVPYNEIFIVD